jgi:hypothetical protein
VTFLHRGSVRFTGSVGDLIALAPEQRYVVRVRNGHPELPPSLDALQLALGSVARVGPGPGGLDHFLLEPDRDGAIGAAVAALARAGYDVLACRQERAEIEEAFLALTGDDPAVVVGGSL